MVEAGIGLRTIRRHSSWYDRSLVTRQGEDILARIDWRGIAELRAHRLIWSSWQGAAELPTQDLLVKDGVPQLRWISVPNPLPLRLFFLSLAWRAGATTQKEFRFSLLPADIVEDLRSRVASEDPGSPDAYPVQLFQIVTRGAPHNRTPTLERKSVVNVDGSDSGLEVDYVRFYFDGLVAHVHLSPNLKLPNDYCRFSCLGFQPKTPVFAHAYETSRASKDIAEMIRNVANEAKTVPIPKTPVAEALGNLWKPKA